MMEIEGLRDCELEVRLLMPGADTAGYVDRRGRLGRLPCGDLSHPAELADEGERVQAESAGERPRRMRADGRFVQPDVAVNDVALDSEATVTPLRVEHDRHLLQMLKALDRTGVDVG